MTETSTLLVEPTDSSLQDTNKRISKTFSQCTPSFVPQSHATALSSWLCHEPLHDSGLAVESRSSVKYPSLASPESSTFFQDSCPFKSLRSPQAVFIWPSSLNLFTKRIVSINFRLFMSNNVHCMSRFIGLLSQISSAFLPEQLFNIIKAPVVFQMYSLDIGRIFEHQNGMFMNFVLEDFLHDECSPWCSCSEKPSA